MASVLTYIYIKVKVSSQSTLLESLTHAPQAIKQKGLSCAHHVSSSDPRSTGSKQQQLKNTHPFEDFFLFYNWSVLLLNTAYCNTHTLALSETKKQKTDGDLGNMDLNKNQGRLY